MFTGNELGALIGWFSLHCYKLQNPKADLNDCYFLASTVSSKMLRAIAKAEGLHFIETLTGFKWMGKSSRHHGAINSDTSTFQHLIIVSIAGNRTVELKSQNKTVLFAFEEAIGFMFGPNVLDKDGVSSACHLGTMAAYLKQQGVTLNEKLEELYDTYGYHFTINSYYLCYEPKTIKKIFERIRNFKEAADTVSQNILIQVEYINHIFYRQSMCHNKS